MTAGVTIRPLQVDDHAEWLRLRKALWPDAPDSEQEGEMADIMAHVDLMPVFVAQRSEGGLCGLLELSIRRQAEGCTTDRIGYLEGWYVDPDRRREGIGRRLVQAAELWAREQGCLEMASDTTVDYPDSPAAHESLGFTEVSRLIHFHKSLAPDRCPE